nr:unnamed protein product [Callosobruchus analis]
MDFEEELINEVRCNDLLWDKRSEYYKNRAKTDRAWEAVANKLKKPKDHVKSKWRGLRDVFLREMMKVQKGHSGDAGSPSIKSYTGKWPYFNDMWFLKDTVLPRPTEHNFAENETEEGSTIDDVAGGVQIQEESREDNDAIQTSTQGDVQQVPIDEQETLGDPDFNLVDISENTPKRLSSTINGKAKRAK